MVHYKLIASPTLITKMADLLIAEISKPEVPPLLALAIVYEIGQGDPAIYLATETAFHFSTLVTAEAPPGEIRFGPLFNSGEWMNPARSIFLDVDPEIDAWAKLVFDQAVDAARNDRDYDLTEQEILSTLWAVIDAARQKFDYFWPPISFVQSVDTGLDEMPTRIATRSVVT